MFKVNNNSIFITRGDVGAINVSVDEVDGTPHVFNRGEVVRFTVFEKKDHTRIVLIKSVEALGGETEIEIKLTSSDTRFGEVINEPKDYWFEIELNPDTSPQTIVGYDENGAKIFRLFPESEGGIKCLISNQG